MKAADEITLADEARLEENIDLHVQRLQAVVQALVNCHARRVVDLGCGEGRLLERLLSNPQFTDMIGLDASQDALDSAGRRLKIDRMPAHRRRRIQLLHGSAIYRDTRLEGFDATAVIEVIEHLDLSSVADFERAVFEFAHPRTVILTTPNSDYNVRWASLPAGNFRHSDHRFEWSRAEFEHWSSHVCGCFGYTVTTVPIGHNDPEVGAPTQMGIFTTN
ncbi:MAG: methyltransferase domain-containing protein [bacterium]|nr:methyltransferase domain-containing protein [bacterium]